MYQFKKNLLIMLMLVVPGFVKGVSYMHPILKGVSYLEEANYNFICE